MTWLLYFSLCCEESLCWKEIGCVFFLSVLSWFHSQQQNVMCQTRTTVKNFFLFFFKLQMLFLSITLKSLSHIISLFVSVCFSVSSLSSVSDGMSAFSTVEHCDIALKTHKKTKFDVPE